MRVRAFLVLSVVIMASTPRIGAQTASLGWMSGCWEYRKGDRAVTEQWSIPRAGMMFGSGHTTNGVATREYEQTRIFDREGKTIYEARPSGQAQAEFVAERLTTDEVVFSNPTHDFPQRVSYRRVGADSLVARVEATNGGRVRGVDFPYHRIACSPAKPF